MAPKQREALFRLAYLTLVFASLASVILAMDWVSGHRDRVSWGYVSILVFLVLGTSYVIYNLWRYLTRQDTEEDERDRIIVSRVSRYQNYATMLTLVGWLLLYLSRYESNWEMPDSLVLWVICSTLLVNVLARHAGVLIAYWLANRSVTRP